MSVIKVKAVKVSADVITPSYANPGDAGLDIHSFESVQIEPGHHATIRTGLKLEIPEGVYARIASRSGLTATAGVHVGAGVIDPTYRGEIHVVLFNCGRKAAWITRGAKFAQLVFEKFYTAELQFEEELSSNTQRAEKGFGSSDE